MKFRTIFTLLFCITLSLGVSAKDAKLAGIIVHNFFSPERNDRVEVYVWYPTASDSVNFIFGQNKVFLGTKTSLNAPVLKGRHPVILLAHGGMRSSPFHSGWIASGLAKKGFIVVVPQYDFSKLEPALASHELWLRPSDLSNSLVSIENIPFFKDFIDKEKIYGVGFFLGGTSMLSLAGAKFEPNRYKKSCLNDKVNIDCAWLYENKIDLSYLPDIVFFSNKNNRLKSVVVINPELTKTLDENFSKLIDLPVKVIDIRDGESEMDEYLDFDNALRAIPNLKKIKLSESNLFGAFSLCTPIGKTILSMEGGENICIEPKSQKREHTHKLILEEITNFIDD